MPVSPQWFGHHFFSEGVLKFNFEESLGSLWTICEEVLLCSWNFISTYYPSDRKKGVIWVKYWNPGKTLDRTVVSFRKLGRGVAERRTSPPSPTTILFRLQPHQEMRGSRWNAHRTANGSSRFRLQPVGPKQCPVFLLVSRIQGISFTLL